MIGDEKSRETILVDPVLEHAEDYLKTLDQRKLTLTHVIDTHTHADHISGGAAWPMLIGSSRQRSVSCCF